jgi:uncharacterized repeat protein (TIGR03847 family)
MIEVELTDPHRVTVGWSGQPGARTFFVQASDDDQQVTLLLEKEQVRGIGELLTQLLARLDDAPATDWDREAMALQAPLEPLWRVGGLSVGLDPERGRFVIELEEIAPDDEDDPREVRIWADQEQARRLAAHAAEQVDQGRPTCQLCGRPIEADGDHVCPATNGHGPLGR